MTANHENGTKPETTTGRVVWFSEEKGFGLIECEGGGTVVVDHTSILPPESGGEQLVFKTLESGSAVEFELFEDSNGRRFAKMVRLAETSFRGKAGA